MTQAERIKIIRFIQGDLPLEPRPYSKLAKIMGLSEEDIVSEIATMKAEGVMRRFGMAVRHKNLGYLANGMAAFDVADDRVDAVASIMTKRREVSHCYLRPRIIDWPYNLYAMIHGRTRDEVLAVAEKIANQTGETRYEVLFSIKELKRTSMRYFSEDD
ncbi:MAG: hypothetical protein P9M14_08580 [Candidatus Alcyoniella australis]|nr:hypothetical protein [Candidatus Alcyoniella australis]